MRRALLAPLASPAPSPRPALSALAASLVLLAATAAGAHPAPDRERRDLEHPEPRPCKCRRPDPPLAYQTLTPGTFAAGVVGHAHHYTREIHACLTRARASSAVLAFTFARGTTAPRVTTTGPRALATCLASVTWNDFTAPARAATVRVRVSTGPAALSDL